jgi:hypothetical protein
MSWVGALDSAIEAGVRWRRAQRRRQSGEPMKWYEEPWRVDQALRTGIRFTDDELLQMMRGPEWPALSYNEAKRGMELLYADLGVK